MSRYTKLDFANGEVPRRWKEICLFEVEHPEMTQQEKADALGIQRKTLYELHHDDRYMTYYHKENERIFRSLESLAIQAMTKQAKKNNIKAAQYILDYLSYKAPDKVDLQSNGVVEINLTNEDGDPFTLNNGDEDED